MTRLKGRPLNHIQIKSWDKHSTCSGGPGYQLYSIGCPPFSIPLIPHRDFIPTATVLLSRLFYRPHTNTITCFLPSLTTFFPCLPFNASSFHHSTLNLHRAKMMLCCTLALAQIHRWDPPLLKFHRWDPPHQIANLRIRRIRGFANTN